MAEPSDSKSERLAAPGGGSGITVNRPVRLAHCHRVLRGYADERVCYTAAAETGAGALLKRVHAGEACNAVTCDAFRAGVG